MLASGGKGENIASARSDVVEERGGGGKRCEGGRIKRLAGGGIREIEMSA